MDYFIDFYCDIILQLIDGHLCIVGKVIIVFLIGHSSDKLDVIVQVLLAILELLNSFENNLYW